jgi:AmiR/NasT family two-component response regulator
VRRDDGPPRGGALALTDVKEPAFIGAASKRGVFAYINDIDVALRRLAEYQTLQEAFNRRASIEQAKGILMARRSRRRDARGSR